MSHFTEDTLKMMRELEGDAFTSKGFTAWDEDGRMYAMHRSPGSKTVRLVHKAGRFSKEYDVSFAELARSFFQSRPGVKETAGKKRRRTDEPKTEPEKVATPSEGFSELDMRNHAD